MTDTTTHQPLRVLNHGTVGPYMIVRVNQLDEIKAILNAHGISYWVDEDEISIDGKPATTMIDFGRNGDASAVQAIFDGVQ